MTNPNLSREERIDLVKGLYARLAAGDLQGEDILPVDDALFSDTGDLIRRMHADETIFDQYF